jgi:hypothetical protein
MAVRSCTVRPGAGGFTTIANITLAAIAAAGGIGGLSRPAAAAETWANGGPRSVLVTSKGTPNKPGNVRVISDRVAGQPAEEGLQYDPQYGPQQQGLPIEPGLPVEQGLEDGRFDPGFTDGAETVAAPEAGGFSPDPTAVPYGHYEGSPEAGYGPVADAAACGVPGCPGTCETCRSHGDPAWRFNRRCESPGLFQKLFDLCGDIDDKGLWTGRADALILYRNAPAFRPLYVANPGGQNALNANQLNSLAAVGPRVSLFRKDAHHCGTSWESTYIYSGGFVAERNLPFVSGGYNLAEPGIFGVKPTDFPDGVDIVSTRLVSSLQSAELNRRWAVGSCAQLIGGFRWIQWQENLSISDAYALGTTNAGADYYNTNCVNDLYGGQIGLDTLLWQPAAKGFRLEGLLKAGAYYNNAVQNSSLSQPATPYSASVGVGKSPAACSFAGEVGLTGVVPICCNWDVRFGYFGLWLTAIAQPTNQLSGQTLDSGNVATIGQPVGSLNTSGSVVLQGLSLGLEGRW